MGKIVNLYVPNESMFTPNFEGDLAAPVLKKKSVDITDCCCVSGEKVILSYGTDRRAIVQIKSDGYSISFGFTDELDLVHSFSFAATARSIGIDRLELARLICDNAPKE
ncbi:MAG: hypothetical protein US63_C0036G0003 [Candidatus Moranbacteria bacterium GW2011_GWC2_37_8]|nr:MAG: hypothetical protein US63_C0036G0003 [Candidatus Moranbacteria bacterium GW2011_GWC2_37_8]KKQ60627.1 MAG: hypothetical protein US82_C0031G0008 [Parcubacteria group bacterium GW2011_GWC1_38_22]KKQ80621.1 MAG: hypothetical protein UT03_C0021G0004 [Candidatus Moranbacteria bacterium GW2011_GWD2_38_7]